jgi:hypothetical protein
LKISSEETKNSECWWKFSAGEANRTLLLSENPESENSLVEGFAIEITKGNVPEMLKNGTFWNWTPEHY